MRLVREVTALEAAFFAMHPGNMDYRARDMTVSSLNFADMAALHAADTGTEAARLPWQTPLTLFQTLQGSLHRFSFHEPGDPAGQTPSPRRRSGQPSWRARSSRWEYRCTKRMSAHTTAT